MDAKKYFDNKFGNVTSLIELMGISIDVPDEILNEMPKYRCEDTFNVDNFDHDFLCGQKEHSLRQAYIKLGMYGFVSWRWIEPFVEWINGRKVLEVMAGRGWLSHALRLKDVDVIATDNFSWSNHNGWKEPLTKIIEADAVKSIDLFGDKVDIVVMSWPYMDNTAFQVLKRLHEVNPSALVVYIGEHNGGCTADKAFHQHFEEIKDKKFNNVISNYQSWHMIHDRPFLGKYRE